MPRPLNTDNKLLPSQVTAVQNIDDALTPTKATGIANLGLGAAQHDGSSSSSEANIPIPAFLRHSKAELKDKFNELEWQQRHRISHGIQEPSESQWARLDSSANPEVLRRNRYLNVEPFASNRVKLKVPDGQSDYINASPIILTQTKSGTEKKYVATQGPKEDSHSHIWRMIYNETGTDEEDAVVVMLTQTHEAGKEKCFRYFPNSLEQPTLNINEEDEFEDGFSAILTLEGLVEDEETRSSIREIDLAVVEEDAIKTRHKKVWHFLFSGWPDFLVPEGPDRAALLTLIAKSVRLNSRASSPRIVHCSAGVGRSGTFIALDYLLQEIAEGAWDDLEQFDLGSDGANGGASTEPELSTRSAGNRDSLAASGAKDPIFECVDSLRQQRMMMVQGEVQFFLLYEVCKEAWIERWRAKEQDSIAQ